MNNVEQSSSDRHQQVVRPTEAQLRWSQFHHRRRAVQVKAQVEELWLQPPSVQEVQGARSDDGNTTEESQTKVSSATVPRSKPVISRGRRAMLRVSKRACTERQADIEKYGFFRGNETTGGASSSDDDDDDGLANLFAEEENFLRKRKRRHRRRNAAATDQERVRRFEAAFHAMMMNLAAAQPVNPAVQIPTKIWSRPDGPLTDTVDGREYMDLKWGVVNREHSVSKHGAGDLSMDRGASWLVHLPGKPVNSSARGGGGDDDGSAQPHIDYGVPADYQEYIEEHGFPPSPVRRRFTDIVSQVQQNVLNNAERSADRESAVPIMRLSKYYQPAQLEGYADDEKKEEEQLLQRYLEGATNETSRKRLEAVFAQVQGGSPSVHERVRDYSKETALTEEYIHDIIKSVDPDVVNELEALDPGISERLLMRYMEETNFDPSKDDVNAVCEHLEIFARRYLVEARYFEGQRDQEVAAVKSSLQVNQQRSNSLVMRFVDQIEETAVAEELISADGRLHKPTFAKLVMQYLGETDESLHRGDKVARRGSGRISERYLEQTTPDDKGQASNKQESSSTTDLVNRFIERMQDDAENESVVDAEGNWDRGVFEHVVSRYLAEASGVEEEVVLDAVDLQALCVGESKQETSRSVQHSGVKEASTAVDQGILETAGRKESSAAVTRAVLEPGRKEAPTAVDQGILEIVGRKEASAAVNQAVLEPRRISAAFTSRFIAQMEQAAEVETLTTEDGKLNKPVFEKLTTRYLVQASSSSRNNTAFLSQARSPLALAQARRNAGRGGRRKRVETPESVGDDEFAGAQSPGFIRRFIRQMEDAAEIEPFVTSEGKLDEATFEKLAKRYLAEAADQRVSVPTDGNADYTAFPPFGHSASIGFVQRFVAHMEEVSRGEELGAIDKPLLEELVLRCLVEFEKDGILDGGKDMESGESNAFDGDVGQLISSGFVEGLAGHLIMASAKDPLVDSDGNLDVSAFERQMTRYLVETASPSKNPVTTSRASARDRQGQFEEERTGQNLTVTKVHQADDATAASPVDTMSPTGSEFFKQMREADVDHPENRMQQNHSSRRGKDSSASITPTGNYQADGLVDRDVASTPQNQLIGDGDNAGDETTSNFGMAQRLAGSVSKVGGFVQMMYGKSRNKEEELEAVAAFRRTQGDRDDTSSLSSFRISDGIKQVVQGFRTSHLSPKDEADEHAFSGNDAGEDVVGDLARQSSYESYEDRASASLYSQDSYSQAESATASGTGFSPERAKIFHRMVMDKSALIGDANADRSIIDTDGSDASRSVIDPDVLKNLLLSPTILTKRHKQAIRAVEQRSWEQVSYLISANPWLAEMTDMGTSQYLLHKLALYGAGQANIDKNTGEVISIRDPAAPDQINTDLIRMFPASVHKFDQDGNLPLHMAAASANSSMIKLLGDRFPGGASVRNEDGMLPLHLTILACASPSIESLGSDGGPIGIIKNVLQYFPGAVAVVDNEGNLPIHTAAAALRGHIGVDVIYHLLDEAHRQLQSSSGARFRNKMKVEDMESASVTTETTIAPTDSANEFDDIVHCNMVRNEFDETPLLVAIHARAGWEMIEAIACGEGGLRAALWQDSGMNNSLHLLVSDRFKDSAAALSILKVAPEAATVRNDEGMLPIEIACMQMLPREVILALVLVDLPINLDQKVGVEVRDGFGGSWWYLTCECDDHYVDVVDEVVSILSYPQVRETCFMKGSSDESLISRATPKCRNVLQRALRFVGRFEFLGSLKTHSNDARGLKAFDALDFGTKLSPFPDGRRVLLKCYAREDVFTKETDILRENEVDSMFVEEVLIFAVGEDGSEPVGDEPKQYCVAIERPNLTLGGVASGMLDNKECQTDPEVRRRYNEKVFSVLRLVAKSLLHLHSLGIVHGNVCMENCGKYDDKWKLSDTLGMQHFGVAFDSARFGKSAAPESIEPAGNTAESHEAAFRHGVVAETSIDSWAFGKLAYEVLTGQDLVEFDTGVALEHNHGALMNIMHWSDFDQGDVEQKLTRVGVSNAGLDLIIHCLAPRAEDRPSMDQILSHPVWKDRRQATSSGRGRERRRRRS